MHKIGLIVTILCLIVAGMLTWSDYVSASDPSEEPVNQEPIDNDQSIIHMPNLPNSEIINKPDKHRKHKDKLSFDSPVFESPLQ